MTSDHPNQPVRVGISTPWDFAELTAADKRSRLGAIADAGIDQVFTADHVSFHDGSGIDGVVSLAALSGIEARLDLYLGVYLLALRHPMIAARQIATLAEHCPGRLTVGIGVGGEDRHEFEVCGVDPATRGRRTDAALGLVRDLLAGKTVDGDGEFFDFVAGQIKPTPDPSITFTVGGRSDAALDRAARLGDGWLAAWCSARRFAQATALIEELSGDRHVDWQHGVQIWVGVGDNPAAARDHVAERMARFYKLDFEVFAKYTPYGSPERIAEFLRPYVDAGARTLNLTPCGPNPAIEIETLGRVKQLLI